MTEERKKIITDPDKQAGADRIAETLGENERKPRTQIEQIVEMCGLDYADELLAETLSIEENGGMLTNEGDRRRTPGGVFFQLARKKLPQEIREQIFHQWRIKMRAYSERENQFPPFDYADRMPTLEAVLAEQQGELSDVKVTLTGRPGAIERRQDLVVTSMVFEPNNDHPMPKGVPALELEPMTYVVYISARQWEKVEKSLEDDKDKLVIEGILVRDPEIDGWSVLATFITTRKLEKLRAQREKQQAATKAQGKKPQGRPQGKGQPRPKKSDQPGENGQPTPTGGRSFSEELAATRPASAQPAPEPAPAPAPAPTIDLPPGVPPEVGQKLAQLMKAAATYRQKVASLEAKPPNQQHGLDMTRKLLANMERQIETIKREHSIEA